MIVQGGVILESQDAYARGAKIGGAVVRGLQVYTAAASAPMNLLSDNIADWESGHYDGGGVKNIYPSRIRYKNLFALPSRVLYFNTYGVRDSIRFLLRAYNSSQVFMQNISEISNGYVSNFAVGTAYLGISIYDNANTALTFADYQNMFSNGQLMPWISLA